MDQKTFEEAASKRLQEEKLKMCVHLISGHLKTVPVNQMVAVLLWKTVKINPTLDVQPFCAR